MMSCFTTVLSEICGIFRTDCRSSPRLGVEAANLVARNQGARGPEDHAIKPLPGAG